MFVINVLQLLSILHLQIDFIQIAPISNLSHYDTMISIRVLLWATVCICICTYMCMFLWQMLGIDLSAPQFAIRIGSQSVPQSSIIKLGPLKTVKLHNIMDNVK